MTTAERLARQLLAAMQARDIDAIGALVTPDFVDHGAPPWVPPGREGYQEVMRFVTQVLGLDYVLEDTVAFGDRVAVRATAHGVHTTPYLGVEPTGKPFAMATMHLFRAEGDLLAEHWGVRDEVGVLVQLGAFAQEGPPVRTSAAR